MRDFRIVLLISTLIASPSAILADDAVKCVQAQLNALGYDAGSPDGQIGKRTKSAGAAYIEFMKANNPGWNMPPVDAANARHWCEKVAEAWPEVNDQWVALQTKDSTDPANGSSEPDAVEKATETVITKVVIDKGANFRVAVMKSGAPIWESDVFGRDASNWAVPIPKVTLLEGDQVCYAFEKGWVVLDSSGTPFQLSCQPLVGPIKDFMIESSEMTYEMKIQKSDK